jgi:hypothetical protein
MRLGSEHGFYHGPEASDRALRRGPQPAAVFAQSAFAAPAPLKTRFLIRRQACLDTCVEAARVGACATSAQRGLITFGGPQGLGDSLAGHRTARDSERLFGELRNYLKALVDLRSGGMV